MSIKEINKQVKEDNQLNIYEHIIKTLDIKEPCLGESEENDIDFHLRIINEIDILLQGYDSEAPLDTLHQIQTMTKSQEEISTTSQKYITKFNSSSELNSINRSEVTDNEVKYKRQFSNSFLVNIKNLFLATVRFVQVNDMKRRPWFDWFIERIGKPDSVLDVCSAYGLWFYGASKHGHSPNCYIGIDINDDYLQQGSFLSIFFQKTPGCFQHVDVTQGLPYKNNSFSQVWMMLWWVFDNHQLVIDEVHRVLKQNGDFFIMCSNLQQSPHLSKFNVVDTGIFSNFDGSILTMYHLKKN